MWYVFLWLNACSLTVLCQRAFNPYYQNYLDSYLYPSIYLNRLSHEKQEFSNKLRRNSHFGNQQNLFRKTYHPYFPKADYIRSIPRFNKNTMVVMQHPSINPVEYNQIHHKLNQEQNHSLQYLPSRKLNPYTKIHVPFSIVQLDNYKNDRLPRNGDFLDNKMIRCYEDDSSILNPNSYSDNLSTEKSISNFEIFKIVTKMSPKLQLKELILPSGIILENLGPWKTKSEKEIISQNVGSLSLIYDPLKKTKIMGKHSFFLSETPRDNITEHEINDIQQMKIESSSKDVMKNIENLPSYEKQESSDLPTLDDSISKQCLAIWEEPTVNTDSVAVTDFDFNDINVFEECKDYVTEDTSTVFPNNIENVSLHTKDVCEKPNYSLDCFNISKTKKFKGDSLIISSNNNMGNYYSDLKQNIQKSSSNKMDKLKKLCNNELNTEISYSDELVTFNFDDYICECYKKSKATNYSPFHKKQLYSRSVISCSLPNTKSRKQKSHKNEEDNYSHALYNFKDGMNYVLQSNMAKVETSNKCFKPHHRARTKRNTTYWLKIFPKRKSKREFHTNRDSSNSSRTFNSISFPAKRNFKRKLHSNLLHHKNQNISRYSKKSVGELGSHGCKSFLEPKQPKYTNKREFVSYEGYGNENCSSIRTSADNITFSTFIFSGKAPDGTVEIETNHQSSSSTYYENTDLTTTYMSTTKHLRFVPDTGNRHPSKMACEELYHIECICYTETAVSDMNNIVSSISDVNILLNELTFYNCTDYRPLTASYALASDLKPRLITKKHKEMVADEKNGPKEISSETFQDLLWRGIPNEGVDFYIFPGTSIQVPCFSHNDIQLSPNLADSTKYEWKHGDGKSITEGRVVADVNHKGMLQITDAAIVDSDNYTCSVSYVNPDTEEEIRNTFIHSVKVVSLPKLALHTLLHYNAPVKCEQETLEMFELYLPQQIEELICYCENLGTKMCTVEIHNPLCHGKNIQVLKEGPKSFYRQRTRWLRQLGVTSEEDEENSMELSLNYELDMVDVGDVMSAAVNKTHCDPFCQLKVLLKLVEILRDSFVLSLTHSVNSSVGVIFKADISTLNVKTFIACEGGLKLCQGFCIPCPEHTFSGEGSTECTTCPRWTYQPHPGSKSCESCPHPFEHGCSSLWTSPKVIGVIILIILFSLLILALLFYLCYRVISGSSKNAKKSNFLQSDHSPRRSSLKKHTFKKKRKIQQRYEESSEHPPTLPSEDFTG